jgi:mRNA interferase MazF
LVLSIPAADEDPALATLVPHTTSVRGSRFEVATKVAFFVVGAFDAQNLVTIPHAKLIRKLGTLESNQLLSVERTVRFWLGLQRAAADS